MRRPAKILLLVLVVALLPLHGIAAMMASCCGLAHESMVAAQSVPDAHDCQSGSSKGHSHCPSAVFLPASAPTPLTARSDERGIALAQGNVPAFFPDNPDRPPLALPR